MQSCVWRQLPRAATCIAVLLVVLCAAPMAYARQPTLQLRITFGGGEPRSWRGAVTLSGGQFGAPRMLSLEGDAPGSFTVQRRQIEILPRTPSVYHGLDIPVDAPLDARLRIRLSSVSDLRRPREFEFTLSELISGSHPLDEGGGLLDDSGNRLVVQRVPGDPWRIWFDRQSLVFSPGETFRFDVVPHLVALERGASLRLKLRIASRREGKEHFVRQLDTRVTDDGDVEIWPGHEFAFPDGDDVYDITLTVTKRGLLDPLVSARTIAERTLQLVVIDDTPAVANHAMPELVDEFDPVSPNWSERVARLPLLRHLPRMKQGHLSHGETKLRDHQGRKWMQLESGAWQAHPLSIAHPGQPYVLEVEYPDDIPQVLGVSIIEPDSSGEVAPIGLDSGVEVEPAPGEGPGVAKHRLVIWPRTKTPLLLVTSLRDGAAAVFGRVRLYHMPGGLAHGKTQRSIDGRLIAAWLDKPLIPENFSAADALDAATGRGLDDWQTFYQGGSRLSQYLQHAGYNAAVVAAWSEGSTLYPTALLDATPKYDTGVFQSQGQDPVRKDVLEMLLRLFDREGLTLVPALAFDTPLPELEERMHLGGVGERVGMELLNHNGKTPLEVAAPNRGLGTYYNPLDPRVQAAMARVVRELSRRYAHHPSFGGVVIRLSPGGYAQLPGGGWGFDDHTFARFAEEAKVDDPAHDLSGEARYAARARWCGGPGRMAWLQWRAKQMALLYGKLSAEVSASRADARLFLAGPELLDGEMMQQALRPVLPRKLGLEVQLREGLLELGIDGVLLQETPGVTLVQPRPLFPPPAADANLKWDTTGRKQISAQLRSPGTLLFQEPRRLRLASFDAVSPFGEENTLIDLAAQTSVSGMGGRKGLVQSLVAGDQSVVFHGGWMMPLGQQDALKDTLHVLGQLPATPFATVPAKDASTEPVVLRTLTRDGQTYVYLLNPSPWQVQTRLRVDGALGATLTPIGEAELPPLVEARTSSAWSPSLKPYSVVAARFDRPGVGLELEEVTLPAAAQVDVVQRYKSIRLRQNVLKAPRALPGLRNGKFEAPAQGARIPGWLHAHGEDIEVGLDSDGYRSPHALKVSGRGREIWIRSDPLQAPDTGRVAVWVWLRAPNPDQQPPLRLAIEARWRGRSYYRFAKVGAGTDVPLTDKWSPFVLRIDDLPRHSLSEFRVGFDVMGPGEVLIDNVEVYDLSFSDDERTEISKIIATADNLLEKKYIAAADQVLSGYWPQFLLDHVVAPEPRVADIPAEMRTAPPRRDTPAAAPSRMDRVKGWFRWPF